jgi:hypothetical protein
VFGAAIGLTICARAEIALCVPLLAWPMIARARVDGVPMMRRERVTHAVIVTGLAAALLAPWTIYNLSRFDRPVLISTNDGLTLAGANCDQTYSGPGIGFWSLQCGVDAIASAERAAQAKPDHAQPDQSVISADQRSIATRYISDHLGELPKVMAARVLRVWSLWDPRQMVYLNTGEGRETWASWMATYAFWGLAATSIIGARSARRRSITVAPLISLTVIVTIVAMVFYGITRFRLPAEIAMIVYAAIALDTVTARTNRGPTSSVAATTTPT